MKKAVTYVVIAIFLGIALTIVPLVTLAEINPTDNHSVQISVLHKMRELEGYSSLERKENTSDEVTVLAVSFIIACIGYMVLKRKTPRYQYQWGRLY
ncbi:hypothetical protein DRO44_02655 [Candidatus Bathyarchaeota archaeon]|nr:MAG: hypothetical protein DRO44_02655 [Candidatus Bathyarchaeota archaeon]